MCLSHGVCHGMCQPAPHPQSQAAPVVTQALGLPPQIGLCEFFWLRGSLQAGGTSQCRFCWGQTSSVQGRLCQIGVSEMEEVGDMRGGEFPGNEQSKRAVSQWWTCSLQPLEGDWGVTGTMVGETTSPGFRTGRAQGHKQNRAEWATGGVPGQ